MADQGKFSKRSEKDKKYDQDKRERVFQPSWKVTYPWLEYDASKKVMYCKTCRRYVLINHLHFKLDVKHVVDHEMLI